MGFIFLILVIILALVGIAGAIIPGLPGPPVSFLALLVLHFTSWIDYHANFLFIMGAIAAFITVLDYWVPIYGTKKFGGTKAGVYGSTIGLIVGVIILPFAGIIIGPFGLFGILLGPFVGALIGENMAGTQSDQAFKAAIGSFIGFVAGTMVKLIYAIAIIFYVVKDLLTYVFYRGDGI
jgi:uncharacterized protein